MLASEICKIRKIHPIEVATPLIVPSFSSRGFPRLGELYRPLRDYVPQVSLISAFDIYYGHFGESDFYASNTMVIDSGGYEARSILDLDNGYLDERQAQKWSRDQYHEVLSRLAPESNLVLISYDADGSMPLAVQAEQAQSTFAAFQSCATDFLCKPHNGGSTVDIKEIIDNLDHFRSFSIFGVTEKELGRSMLDRCRNVFALRKALGESSLEMPIHIFGCLEPMSILAYFLCGADIFDGLAWLRFAFHNGIAIYRPNASVLQGLWKDDDENNWLQHSLDNLSELKKLGVKLTRFCGTYDMSIFDLPAEHASTIRALVNSAGVEL